MLSFWFSLIEKVSIWPSYNKNGSAIKAFVSSKKPLNIFTLSFTTFSFRQVDINVWSAPDNVNVKLVFVTSVSSVKLETPKIKSDDEYVTLEPDTELVSGKEQSVIFTGVPNPIVMRWTGLMSVSYTHLRAHET